MRSFVLFMIPLGLVAAADKSAKPTTKPQAAQQTQTAAKSGSITVPADAEMIGPQVYRAKDANGKSWIYRKTPFGISRMEENPAVGTGAAGPIASAPAKKSEMKVKATDLGESVRFEQATPMGNRVWERKKADLTPQEKAWLEQPRTTEKDPGKPEN